MERKITIEEKVLYQEDYQMRMLKANHLERLLRIGGRGVDGNSCYDYDVSGKISMRALYERNNIKVEDIKIFLSDLKLVISEIGRYLLDIHCILLNPEYVFYEDRHFYFCYYPPAKQELWEEFHQLTEYFVKHADYQDEQCIQMVFLLHKKTMEDNYSLEKLITECLQNSEKMEGEKGKEDHMKRLSDQENSCIEYDTVEHDWIAEQELGSSIMRETENLWTPMKRFLTKHKKPKWGDWDGLHIEEEEL